METFNPVREPQLPKEVIDAYPLLIGGTLQHTERVLSPLHPDIAFNIYTDTSNNSLFIHVATDHPDPLRDSKELFRASQKYSFGLIVTPFANQETIKVADSDELEGNFFIKEGITYHYVARN